ncbi:MAG: cupin domain-containing protein [Alphaproteobacteria bacterium]|nr:cupin domain-containing protein [Alphaproteobacteria bacterium]
MNIQTTPEVFDQSARRTWGHCTPLTEQGRFKVRHLIIAPGQSLGLQSHFHRSEHWIAVSGSGRVTLNGVAHDLFENQSVDIPIGALHMIENHGKVDLHLIEVQTGAYLGEDDIIRHAS